jgi:Cft2 family RNA processing exonuclease
MQLRFLGACQEVGRSAIAVKNTRSQILMDYGVMINHEVGFPVHISPKDLNAVVLTHAHLDHSGLIPLFYTRSKLPVYGIEPTFKLTKVLVRDMIKLSGYYLPFEYMDLESMLAHAIPVSYNSKFNVKDAALVGTHFTQTVPAGAAVDGPIGDAAAQTRRADVNCDGIINIRDGAIVAVSWGKSWNPQTEWVSW